MYKGRPLIISKVPFFRKSFFGLNPFRWYSLIDVIVNTDEQVTTEGYYTVGDGGGGTFSWNPTPTIEATNSD